VDRRSFSLQNLAINYLKDVSKRDYVKELKQAFKVRSKSAIYSAKGAPIIQPLRSMP
jgi:hypothetical protein